jgi:(S)-ureidoglycine aminohydrolase
MALSVDGQRHELAEGGFAFIPANSQWSLHNSHPEGLKFLWVRKPYEPLEGLHPATIVGNEKDIQVKYNPTTDKKWTTQLIPAEDMAYDLNMNIVSFEPGTVISNVETHIMEHGLYMLQGKGVYLLNTDWREVREGDFIWMRSFCPQAYCAGGLVRTRYLLYKDVNRQVTLRRNLRRDLTG